MRKGKFIVSLDFELFYGLFGHIDINDYKENITGAKTAILPLLELLKKHNIHATWAVVGFLMAENREEALSFAPEKLPHYNKSIDTYRFLRDEKDEDILTASELIKYISKTKGQEIASHTFSHFYCTEKEFTPEDFKNDMKAALSIAKAKGYDIKSVVFPKNLYKEEHIEIVKSLGFKAFRGLRGKWLYGEEKTFFKRCLRLLDTYIPITGNTCSTEEDCGGIYNICDSMMYRPYFKPLFFLEWLKIHRIKCQMKHAAKKGLNFHLWWHPHNIGVRTGFHLKQLEDIFSYFGKLNQKYGMESLNMSEASEAVKK